MSEEESGKLQDPAAGQLDSTGCPSLDHNHNDHRRDLGVQRTVTAAGHEHATSRASKGKPKVKRSTSYGGSEEQTAVSGGRKSSRKPSRQSSRTQDTEESLSRMSSRSETLALEDSLLAGADALAKEAQRRRIEKAVVIISVFIFIAAIFLVAATLLLSPNIDDILRKENEEIMRSMTTPPSAMQRRAENATVEPPTG